MTDAATGPGSWFLPLILAVAAGLLASFVLDRALRNGPLPAKVRRILVFAEAPLFGGAIFYVLYYVVELGGNKPL